MDAIIYEWAGSDHEPGMQGGWISMKTGAKVR